MFLGCEPYPSRQSPESATIASHARSLVLEPSAPPNYPLGVFCVTLEKSDLEVIGESHGATTRKKQHLGDRCILSFLRVPVNSSATRLKLAAFGAGRVMLKKIGFTGQRSRSLNEKGKICILRAGVPLISSFTLISCHFLFPFFRSMTLTYDFRIKFSEG